MKKNILDTLFQIKARRKKQLANKLPFPYPHPLFWVATWGGVGHLPFAGTWGTLFSLPFIWVCLFWGNQNVLIAFTVLSFFIGWKACTCVEKQTGEHDHKSVVIDEVFGMALVIMSFMYLGLGTALHWFVAFILFRAFDMIKPPPISQMDQKLDGPLGVMLDDGMAALFTIFTLWLIF